MESLDNGQYLPEEICSFFGVTELFKPWITVEKLQQKRALLLFLAEALITYYQNEANNFISFATFNT